MGLPIYNPQLLSSYYVTENNGVKINGTLVRVWYCEFGGLVPEFPHATRKNHVSFLAFLFSFTN